jgi:hypothetical protein
MLMSGCTVVNVSPVGSADRPTRPVCIERNPKVVAADFLPVVEDEFRRHGIQTAVYDPPVPARCEYVLEYTARQSWDMVGFLRYAELRLRDREKTIGTATYRHRGGFGLNKWASTRIEDAAGHRSALVRESAGRGCARKCRHADQPRDKRRQPGRRARRRRERSAVRN